MVENVSKIRRIRHGPVDAFCDDQLIQFIKPQQDDGMVDIGNILAESVIGRIDRFQHGSGKGRVFFNPFRYPLTLFLLN